MRGTWVVLFFRTRLVSSKDDPRFLDAKVGEVDCNTKAEAQLIVAMTEDNLHFQPHLQAEIAYKFPRRKGGNVLLTEDEMEEIAEVYTTGSDVAKAA